MDKIGWRDEMWREITRADGYANSNIVAAALTVAERMVAESTAELQRHLQAYVDASESTQVETIEAAVKAERERCLAIVRRPAVGQAEAALLIESGAKP